MQFTAHKKQSVGINYLFIVAPETIRQANAAATPLTHPLQKSATKPHG